MSRFHFSIGTFLAVITLIALTLGAMASQSPLAASAAFTGYVVLLCLASVGAVAPGIANRSFWIGMTVFGWTYWFIEFDRGPENAQPTGGIGLFFARAAVGPRPLRRRGS